MAVQIWQEVLEEMVLILNVFWLIYNTDIDIYEISYGNAQKAFLLNSRSLKNPWQLFYRPYSNYKFIYMCNSINN